MKICKFILGILLINLAFGLDLNCLDIENHVQDQDQDQDQQQLRGSPFVNTEMVIKNVILGASDVDDDKNQCKLESDVIAIKEEKEFNDLIEALKKREYRKILEEIKLILSGMKDFAPLEANCHFLYLGKQFAEMRTYSQDAIIAARIAESFFKFMAHCKEAYKGLRNKDFEAAGKNLGGILRIAFDYHTQ